MVGRVEGIDQSQDAQRINLARREPRTERTENVRGKVKSLKENQLSAEELRDELEDKINDMNDIMETLDEKLSFELHDQTDRIMTRIIDIKTQEVIKEMPPEEMLDLAAKIHEMVGLIIDEEV
ncbi:MAG TPA: flagellar protein FlaG [Halanaerobiales bacterium]|nr:flagellar protein FlaG [Halanaerobiales bacterium]